MILHPGTPSAIGSLPHADVEQAARFALEAQPELPVAPQLPRRHPSEGMLAQVAAGMSGVRVGNDGWSLAVDRRRLGPGPAGAPLDTDAWAGTLAFLRRAAAIGHAGPVKVQIAGPVTLGLALAQAGTPASKAFAVAGAVVRDRIRAVRREVAGSLPDAPVVFVLDEPGLTAYADPSFPLGSEETIDLLSGSLATAGAGGRNTVAGIHCCGPTDWSMVLQAGPDLLSLPVDAVPGEVSGLAMFLDRGGWVSWGAVPTDQPLGDRDDAHWRKLNGLWGELARTGCDPMRLRLQSVITPACGLALHRPSQAAQVYELVRRLAERVQDQALAARLSAGA